MKKILILCIILFAFLFTLQANETLQENEENPPKQTQDEKLAEAALAYTKLDYSTAKIILLELNFEDSKKMALVDFLLSNIAALDGDIKLAKDRFPKAFKNLPPNNELVLAQNFSKFADLNEFYEMEVELLSPFYKEHPKIFDQDSMLYFRYAKALFKTDKKLEAQEILLKLWDKFKSQNLADGCDELLFNKDLAGLIVGKIKPETSEISLARYRLLNGELEGFTMPKNASLALSFYVFLNTKILKIEDLEAAMERDPDSHFAWRVWNIIAKKCFDEGSYELSYSFATRALTLAPDDAAQNLSLYITQGDSLRFLKRYDEARQCYKTVYTNKEVQGEIAAESIFKTGLSYYDERKYEEAYACFQRVFLAYIGFDYWSSRAYLYGAKARFYLKDRVGGRSVLRDYLTFSKHKDTEIYKEALELYKTTR